VGAKISSFENFAKVTNHYLDESSKANYRSHISCKCVCFVNNSKCVNVLIKCNPKDTFEAVVQWNSTVRGAKISNLQLMDFVFHYLQNALENSRESDLSEEK